MLLYSLEDPLVLVLGFAEPLLALPLPVVVRLLPRVVELGHLLGRLGFDLHQLSTGLTYLEKSPSCFPNLHMHASKIAISLGAHNSIELVND